MRLLRLYGSGAIAGSANGAKAGLAYAASFASASGSGSKMCDSAWLRQAALSSGIGDNGPRKIWDMGAEVCEVYVNAYFRMCVSYCVPECSVYM